MPRSWENQPVKPRRRPKHRRRGRHAKGCWLTGLVALGIWGGLWAVLLVPLILWG